MFAQDNVYQVYLEVCSGKKEIMNWSNHNILCIWSDVLMIYDDQACVVCVNHCAETNLFQTSFPLSKYFPSSSWLAGGDALKHCPLYRSQWAPPPVHTGLCCHTARWEVAEKVAPPFITQSPGNWGDMGTRQPNCQPSNINYQSVSKRLQIVCVLTMPGPGSAMRPASCSSTCHQGQDTHCCSNFSTGSKIFYF